MYIVYFATYIITEGYFEMFNTIMFLQSSLGNKGDLGGFEVYVKRNESATGPFRISKRLMFIMQTIYC